ncbi:MAG: response regulator [Pseudomonadota bacterium]
MAVAYSDPVLLVEDTQSLSMIYQKVMAAAGYYVDCAFTMAEAMRAYGDTGHRIILLDLTLPDGDGLDLLRKAREIDPGVKVVVITANASINRAVEAMRDGAFDFLVKPFDDRRLLTAVDNAIASLALEATEIRSDPQDPEGFFEASSAPPRPCSRSTAWSAISDVPTRRSSSQVKAGRVRKSAPRRSTTSRPAASGPSCP